MADTQKIQTLLQEALQSEEDAKHFYINASKKAQSTAGKKLFSELAAFEQHHYIQLQKIIQDHQKNNTLDQPEEIDTIQHIPSEIKGEFEPNKDEIITVLSLAIESEKQAQHRYDTIADLFEDTTSKTIFKTFAQEERNHQKILEDQVYHLSNKGTVIWD